MPDRGKSGRRGKRDKGELADADVPASLEAFLEFSDLLRPGFSRSLGRATAFDAEVIRIDGAPLPPFLFAIYSRVQGTRFVADARPGDIDATLLDFLPGYRLLHRDELAAQAAACRTLGIAAEGLPADGWFPFLTNHNDDYFCWADGRIFEISDEAGLPGLVHKSPARFYQTVCAFYTEGVYHLDDDGFLEYDYAEEEYVGFANNPGVPYWISG